MSNLGYAVIYLDHRNQAYCPACAPSGSTCHGYPEGPVLECMGCEGEIASDYGEPEDDA